MLEIRPNCERCDVDLPATSSAARICTYECTFCAECVSSHLSNVCPNCGGGFERRPIRPAKAWRDGTGLDHQPASTTRHHLQYPPGEVEALSARLRDVAPESR